VRSIINSPAVSFRDPQAETSFLAAADPEAYSTDPIDLQGRRATAASSRTHHGGGTLTVDERAALARGFAAIAFEAGAAILRVYAGEAAATAKSDGSPLTVADLASEAVIAAGLAALCPALPVISEEGEGAAAATPAGPFLLVDPLDGTKEFLGRSGEFTVNIALVEDGRPTAGVVLAPPPGRLWLGVAGQGAECRDGDAVRAIAVRRRDEAAGLVAVASRSHRDAATEAFLATLPVKEHRAIGSSLKFCLVAEGVADVYPRFGPTMEWDTAAGQAVLEAAGGRVATPEGAPFRYGKPGWRNGSFIAWGG
jgi:3'(2'), 5'-bisphosphate nucleotidase